MVSQWPQYDEALNFKKEEAEFEILMDAIKAIRNTRSQMNVPPSKKADLFIETTHKDIFENGKKFLERLASAAEVNVGDHFDMDGAVQVIANGSKTLIPMDELVAKDKERARLEKEKAACEKDFAMISGKLNNQGFLAKAPQAVVDGEKAKLEKIKEKMKLIEEGLKNL